MRGWETANNKKDITKLLTMIRDIYHCHDDTKQGAMANVELDSTVYTTFQNPTKFPEYYLATF